MAQVQLLQDVFDVVLQYLEGDSNWFGAFLLARGPDHGWSNAREMDRMLHKAEDRIYCSKSAAGIWKWMRRLPTASNAVLRVRASGPWHRKIVHTLARFLGFASCRYGTTTRFVVREWCTCRQLHGHDAYVRHHRIQRQPLFRDVVRDCTTFTDVGLAKNARFLADFAANPRCAPHFSVHALLQKVGQQRH